MVSRFCIAGLSVLGGLLVAGNVRAAEANINVDTSSDGNAGASAPGSGMHNSISLLANLGYAYSAGTGFGLSGRYQFTIVPEGVIQGSSIHDDFGIEPAIDFFHYSWDFGPYSWTYNEVGLSAAVVWNLWFTEQFAAYPRLGLGFAFGSWSDNDGIGNPGGYGGLILVGGAGVLYQLGSVTLRAELSNASLGLGIAFNL